MTIINKEKAIVKLQGLINSHSSIPNDNGVRQAIEVIKNMPNVEHSIITDPDDYEEYFNDTIYEMLRVMCIAKGIELDGSNEVLEDIRDSIIRHANNYHMDLTIPVKEYKVGDKVDLYVPQGDVTRATIIWIGDEEKYGLLIDDKYTVEYSTMYETVDNPTNYIHYLQHKIGLNVG